MKAFILLSCLFVIFCTLYITYKIVGPNILKTILVVIQEWSSGIVNYIWLIGALLYY